METLSYNPEIDEQKSNFDFLRKFGIEEKGSLLYDINANVLDKVKNGKEQNSYSEAYSEALESTNDPSIESTPGPISEKEIANFLSNHFDPEDIKMGLIESIHGSFDKVILGIPETNGLNIPEGRYTIPVEEFEKHWQSWDKNTKNQLSKFVHRGFSICGPVKDGDKNKYASSPIYLFNQDYDKQNQALINNTDLNAVGIDYLKELPREERRKQYILGSIAHEIAHHWYAYVIQGIPEYDEEWKNIIDKHGNLTGYAQMYEDRNKEKDYDENFAEAVRLITTCPKYLEKNGKKEIADFIKSIFVNIK